MAKRIKVGTIHSTMATQKERFTGWTGGYGLHSDKSKFDRKKNKNELRNILKEE